MEDLSMSSLTPATEEIAEKRIGMTLLIHGILLLGSSAIPEEDFLIWFPINLVIEALIIFQLLRLWKRYKNKPQHYYTIQVYWMLIGLSFFAMLPIVKIMYYTASFWPVLILTVLLFFYAHFIREKIAEVFVNPKKKRQLHLWPVFLCILVFIGILIMAILRAESYHPNLGIAILLYMIGGMMAFVATPFSVSGERLEELKGE
jgi:xanthine/uracil permease